MKASEIKIGQIWELKDEDWNLPRTILILDNDVLSSISPRFNHIHLVSILKYEFGSITVIDEKLNTMTSETILKLYNLKQDTPSIPDEEEDKNDDDLEEELNKKKIFGQFGI